MLFVPFNYGPHLALASNNSVSPSGGATPIIKCRAELSSDRSFSPLKLENSADDDDKECARFCWTPSPPLKMSPTQFSNLCERWTGNRVCSVCPPKTLKGMEKH
ncbi:hypothetical protein LSTR_LSTR001299 [Laodelphax striatellus]|uniref:Uncharacterized protein n=1 Tax=Laodelphax striatellus TaxID=195883 RepID=A0A482XCV3_LAOST|nr:hypothetical protein LSTR_LSTR001299 [Laodelphax striatellus]